MGTSLVNFVNSLATTISAAVLGVFYNVNIAGDPTDIAKIQNGVIMVFMAAAVVSLIGFIIVVVVIRPQMTKE